MSSVERKGPESAAATAADESTEEGEAALYRLLFAVAAFFYVAWWPLNYFAMNVAIDPLWERASVAAVALLGYLTTTRPGWRRLSPWVAETVIYVITVHYFSLIVRNSFSDILQVGLFITLSSIGLVPRRVSFTLAYCGVGTGLAALACFFGEVSSSTWTLVFGGVTTLEAVGVGIAMRMQRITTARERAERALVEAKETAERAARAKDELLAKVSHELRTPMNGVVNMVRLAQDAPLTPAQSEYLETANACADDMLKIINDLLDVSKAQAGRMALHPTRFSLAAMLERALKELVLRAASKGIAMRVMVHPDVPDSLFGDELRLQQVLINLIGNAAKFTEAGTIELEIGAVAERALPSRVRLAVRVSDTGPGIPADRLEQIFVAFAQADGSVSRRFGGTGLGLTISSELVELMGGRLTVTSELGVGSSFRFEVVLDRAPPVLSVEQEAPQTAPVPQPPSRRAAVLVAEDNQTNERIVRAILERAGHEVIAVNNGRRALEELARRPFDVVLLDVQMPELDGFETARRIRSGAVPGRERVPLVALTAQAIAGDRERCLAAGMDACLSKPVDRAELIKTVQQLAPAPDPDAALDEADLQDRLGTDPALLATVLKTYRVESRTLFASIERAVQEQAGPSLRHVAHNLKGALLTLGAKHAARAAAELEEVGATAAWGTRDQALRTLERELARVDTFIEQRYAEIVSSSIAP